MPVAAITTVFETLNTTGQRLTPVEIVTAILFVADINRRDDIDTYEEPEKAWTTGISTALLLGVIVVVQYLLDIFVSQRFQVWWQLTLLEAPFVTLADAGFTLIALPNSETDNLP